MGKRELLIIGAFILVGAVAYQLTAPPPAEDGFSFSGLMDEVRREVRGNPGSAESTNTGAISVSADVTELRFTGSVREIQVIGEDREDIAYTLHVRSNGPDDDEALKYAQAVALEPQDLGFALAIGTYYPPEASQSTAVELRVPTRLELVVGGRAISASNLASVDLDGAIGDTLIEGIRGEVSGRHQSGRLTINGAGSLDLTMRASAAELNGITGGVRLETDRGECVLNAPGGPVRLTQSRTEVRVTGAKGSVEITGSNGQVVIVDPASETRIDTRRTEIEVELSRGAPMTIITTDDTLRLLLADGVNLEVDAATSSRGDIQAGAFDLTAESAGETARLTHTFGTGGDTVVLRNTRGDIVIRRAR